MKKSYGPHLIVVMFFITIILAVLTNCGTQEAKSFIETSTSNISKNTINTFNNILQEQLENYRISTQQLIDESLKKEIVDNIQKLKKQKESEEESETALASINKNKIHKTRYPVNNKPIHKIKIWTYKGGSPINHDKLSSTVWNVMERISIVPKNENIHDLVLETAARESLFGVFVKQQRGPALGIYQIEPTTMNDLLRWLKCVHKDVYREVMVFYERKHDREWNHKFNIPFQTAMCLVHYWYRTGDNLNDLSYSRESRASLWKLTYNTVYGKGTVKAYMASADKYIGKR